MILPSEAYQLAESYQLGEPQIYYRRGNIWSDFLGLLFSFVGAYGGYQLLLYNIPLLFYYFGEREGSFYVLGPFTRYDAVFEVDGSVIDLPTWAQSHGWGWLLILVGLGLIIGACVVSTKAVYRLIKRERVYVCAEGFICLEGRVKVCGVLRWEQIHELRYQTEELYVRYRIPPAQRAFAVPLKGTPLPISFSGLAGMIKEKLAGRELIETVL